MHGITIFTKIYLNMLIYLGIINKIMIFLWVLKWQTVNRI